VKWTALDAAELGFETIVVEDACRGVELSEGDVDDALDELEEAGVVIVSSEEV
jgi:nicotinamidase/pyrazinamidase